MIAMEGTASCRKPLLLPNACLRARMSSAQPPDDNLKFEIHHFQCFRLGSSPEKYALACSGVKLSFDI